FSEILEENQDHNAARIHWACSTPPCGNQKIVILEAVFHEALTPPTPTWLRVRSTEMPQTYTFGSPRPTRNREANGPFWDTVCAEGAPNTTLRPCTSLKRHVLPRPAIRLFTGGLQVRVLPEEPFFSSTCTFHSLDLGHIALPSFRETS